MPHRWRAVIWRYRFVLAALCVGWAAVVVVGDLRPPAPATTPVLVAASDLPAGTVLGAAHLEVVEAADAPAGVLLAEQAVGSVLAVGVPRGLPLVGSLVVGPGLVDAAPQGTVVTPVRLADPAMARMVRVGDVLDLYLAPVDTGGQVLEAQLVTAGALVLSRVDEPATPDVLLGSSASGHGTATGVVILAVAERDATVLSGASALAPFRAVLVDRGHG